MVPLEETSGVHLQPPKGMDLGGPGPPRLGEWPKAEQEQARELLLKWEHLFACSNLDLDRTTLIKHQIEVTDWMPFTEHYQCIPLICKMM